MGLLPRPLLLVALPFALCIRQAQAQAPVSTVSGSVNGTHGGPLAGARVDLWSGTRRLGSATADSDGRFTIARDTSGAAMLVLVRHIGYTPRRVIISTADSSVVVQLEPIKRELAPIYADPGCPRRDDRKARQLWEAMRAHYVLPDTARAWARWVEFRVQSGIVQRNEIGTSRGMRSAPGHMYSGISPGYDPDSVIRERGYARAITDGLRMGSRHDFWSYPGLEGLQSEHFIDRVFGDVQRFGLVEGDGTFGVVFCSASSGKPGIQGVLFLAADSSLERARWTFVTSQPDEKAGGEAVFGLVTPGMTQRRLLPVVGLFWRYRVFDAYQEIHEYDAWHSCETEPSHRYCTDLERTSTRRR